LRFNHHVSIKTLNPTGKRIQALRLRLYHWRQQRPLRRFALGGLFLLVWPVRTVAVRLLDLFGQQPRRVIVVHLAGLGDLLMLTPALAALQDHYPDVKIDLITLHEYVKEAFQNHPRLDRIRAIPAYPGSWIVPRFTRGSNVGLVFETVRFYAPLLLKYWFTRAELGINFGLSDFDRNLGNAFLFCLNVRRRIGSESASDRLLTDRVAVDSRRTHRTDAYLEFLEPLGISSRSRIYEFPVRQVDLDRVRMTLGRENISQSKPLAILNPGGKIHINSRRWPAEYYARLCNFLSVEQGFEVILTGDQNDREVCDEIVRDQNQAVRSMAGRFSFTETAALLSLAQLCVTNDTSTLHLAEAVQVPRAVSIFGPTSPDLLAPRNERHLIFRSNLDCAPCMGGLIDANTPRCWRDTSEECLWKITPDQVITALKKSYEGPVLRVATA
jgi:ADP-heptose:LPS heptosyltransferase